MQELQELNADKDRASNAQIMFLVLNSSSITLLPVSIFTYRAQMGALAPTDVFIPILMTTYCSTITGFLFVALAQRIRLDAVVLAWIGGLTVVAGGMALWLLGLPPRELALRPSLLGDLMLIGLIADLAGMVAAVLVAYAFFGRDV